VGQGQEGRGGIKGMGKATVDGTEVSEYNSRDADGLGRSVMPKQVFAAVAILFLTGGTPGLYAADVMPLNEILKKAEQPEQLPNFGPPPGKLIPATSEALARELPDERFVADGFPPTRLIFPDGTQEPYVSARVLKVVPLTGEQVLKAYAKDVPVDPDAEKSTPAVEESALVDRHLLFDQRRLKEWSK
jgi:hypothetical protein